MEINTREERKKIMTKSINNSFSTYKIVHDGVECDIFNTLLEQILALRLPKNSIIIRDNTYFYKSSKTKALFNEYGYE